MANWVWSMFQTSKKKYWPSLDRVKIFHSSHFRARIRDQQDIFFITNELTEACDGWHNAPWKWISQSTFFLRCIQNFRNYLQTFRIWVINFKSFSYWKNQFASEQNNKKIVQDWSAVLEIFLFLRFIHT